MKNEHYTSAYLQVNPEERTFFVHRDAYRSPEIYEIEKQKVLYKAWIILGHESEVENKGDFVTRTVIDRDILFNRDRTGKVNAFFNTCRHRGPAVARDKKGNRKTFVCPYHGWVYKDDGGLLSTGSEASDATFPPGYCNTVSLEPVPRLESHAGFYFVNFDPAAEPLIDFLDDSADRLQMIADQSAEGLEVISGVHEYEIQANYKLLCENSYDGYHLAPVHESYLEYMMDSIKGSGIKLDTSGLAKSFGNGHACMEVLIRAGRPVAQWIPTMGEDVRAEVEAKEQEVISRVGEARGKVICNTQRNMVIFPNSIINDQQSILIRSIVPLAHNKMLVRAWTMGLKDESANLRKIRLQNMLSFLGPAGFATPDDVTMLEAAQRGYEACNVDWNDFSKGYYAGEKTWKDGVEDVCNELQMRAYYLAWDKMMTA